MNCMIVRMTCCSNETWVPVRDYEELYEVSSCGRVRSLDRLVVRPHGKPYYRAGQMLKLVNSEGYRQVALSKRGKITTIRVHVLVGRHFLPKPSADEYQVRHRVDDTRSNNHATNLAWGTHADNTNDLIVTHGGNWQQKKTHCPKGHELSGDNLRKVAPSDAHRHSSRRCKSCYNKRARIRWAERKAQTT